MPSAFVDFALVRERVSMQQTLDHYRVRLRRVNAQSLRGPCPLPGHRSKGESFCVNIVKNIWACQSASCVAARGGRRGGNVLDFTAAMEQSTIREAALKLQDWFLLPSETHFTARTSPEGKPEKEKLVTERKREASSESPAHNQPLGFTLKGIDHAHPYLATRGVAKETAERFGIGFYSGRGTMHGKIVIPIESREGKLLAYCGRCIDDSDPKYKMPSGFVKALELFNVHRAIASGSDSVVIVEGFFSCIHASTQGYASVALMGSSLSEAQEEIITSCFFKAVLLLDGDEAGREATADIAARLMRRMFIKVINLPDGVQPDQLSVEEIKSILGSL